jgi:hypothetical protein
MQLIGKKQTQLKLKAWEKIIQENGTEKQTNSYSRI